MDISRLFTLDNIRGILWAFSRGFADSFRGAVEIFLLDSRADKRKENRLMQRDIQKEMLLMSRGGAAGRESPAREIESLAKKRAVERRERDAAAAAGRKSSAAAAAKQEDRTETPKVLERTIKCCLFNGCVFWLSIFLFENALLPAIRTVLYALPFSGDSLWHWTHPILSVTFSTLWVLPLFLLSKIVNAIWFQDIADSAFKSTSQRPQMMSSISVMIADTLFSIVVECIFLVQGSVFSLLPIKVLGDAINLVHLCLLHSLYSFEYKWFNQGLELHKRLSYVENNWPYFLGFGLPMAILTSMPSSQVISGCVFSILFPLFIISANQAHVVTGACDEPLRLFSPTIAISNAIFTRTFQMKRIS